MEMLKEKFPSLYKRFRDKIKDQYDDINFKYRKYILRLVPIFENLSDNSIQELLYLMKQKTYQDKKVIVKRGSLVSKIYIVKQGTVQVEIPFKYDTI